MAEPVAPPNGVTPDGTIEDHEAAETAGLVEQTPPEIPFAAFLQTLRRGVVHEELGREFRQLVQDVCLHHKKGTLTFTLTVEPVGTRGQVTIIDDLKVKAPQPDRATQTLWSDKIGNLLQNDPEGTLFTGGLQDVSAPGPAREAAPAPAPREVKP